MRRVRAIALLAAAVTLPGMPVLAHAAAQDVLLEEVASAWGTPYGVSLQQHPEGVTLTGKVYASPVTGGRRMYGRVWAELVDRSGEVVAVHYADPRRLGTASHTNRARFSIEIDRLPETAYLVRVGYR